MCESWIKKNLETQFISIDHCFVVDISCLWRQDCVKLQFERTIMHYCRPKTLLRMRRRWIMWDLSYLINGYYFFEVRKLYDASRYVEFILSWFSLQSSIIIGEMGNLPCQMVSHTLNTLIACRLIWKLSWCWVAYWLSSNIWCAETMDFLSWSKGNDFIMRLISWKWKGARDVQCNHTAYEFRMSSAQSVVPVLANWMMMKEDEMIHTNLMSFKHAFTHVCICCFCLCCRFV